MRPPRGRERTVKLAANTLLQGASSRLLPASIPFRFFGAAVAYYVLAWIALYFGAESLPRFAGGASWSLAALHLVTLGVLAMSAIGASLQLLPVATRAPLRSHWTPRAIWWLYTPGVAALALGMGLPDAGLLAGGAVAVAVALAAFAALLARNLLAARGMPGVVAHGWAAVASLAIVIASALSLAGAYVGAPGIGRSEALALHIAFASYGFMGLLALGFSYILVPMFALSKAPSERQALASCALAIVALALAALAAFGIATVALRTLAVALGAVALGVHLHAMSAALSTGLRRELGRSFRLVRIAWALAAASLVAGLAVALGIPVDGAATLFGVLLIPGWLLTFLLGILQRIVPFLASMHVGHRDRRGKRLPPTPSSLTAQRPLAIHFACHLAALGLLIAAVALDSAWAVRAAALVGFAGAVAFAVFFGRVAIRLVQAAQAAA
ncbi:MAG TPA: hypothetical protein VF814_14230 [Casimicrobiaceae bacterium]